MADTANNLLKNASGPLPITVQYTPQDTDGDLVMFSGTLWGKEPNQLLSLILEVNGEEAGRAEIFSNGINEHRSVSTVFAYDFPIEIDSSDPENPFFKPVEITIKATGTGVETDSEDRYNLHVMP